MDYRLSDISPLISAEVRGDSFCVINNVSEIEDAKQGDLIFALDKKNLSVAFQSNASAVVCSEYPTGATKPALIVKNTRLAMAKILELFTEGRKTKDEGRKKAKFVSAAKSAKIAKSVVLSEFVSIGENVEIGENSRIMPNVTIYNNVKIGKNVIIHAGTVIGVDGYGFVEKKELVKTPQIGGVIIEDDVEIYANCTISRGTIGNTTIGKGTKIDNGCHIAHNCKIGKNCALAGHVAFAGSVTLKDGVQAAGQVGFNGHITVGENTLILGKAGVTKDIPPNSIISGFPAGDHKKETEAKAILNRLIKAYKKSK